MARPPAARDARRDDLAQAALGARRRRRHARGRARRPASSALFIVDRCLRRDARMHRVALGLLLAMAVLEAVYLGGYFALENHEQLSQYAKGMTKFALHFGFLVCGTQHVIDRGERLLRRTIGAFVLGLAINCTYGVAQLARAGRRRRQPRQAADRAAHVRAGRRSAASTSTGRRRPCSRAATSRSACTASTRSRSIRTTSGSCSASPSCCCCRSLCAPGCARAGG